MLRSHPNYVVGSIVWICAICTIILFPNVLPKIRFLKKACVSCSGYSRFADTLTPEQKADFDLLEAGAINIDGIFQIVGKNSEKEYELYKNGLIEYRELDPIIDEKNHRLILFNSLIKTLSPEIRNMVLDRRAAILFREGRMILVHAKSNLIDGK